MAGAEVATPDIGACELPLTASIARAMPTSTAAPAIPAVITLSAVRPREREGGCGGRGVHGLLLLGVGCSGWLLRYLDGALRSARAPSKRS